MRPSRHVLAIAALVAVMILGVDGLATVALAKDPPKTYRRYDEQGRFQGITREDEEGNLRFYDKKGQYKGYADRQKDGSWRTYDEKGEFDGTIREDPD
ncbi:MAG: hypothetical protein JNK40_02235 [Chromatiales bacterium]|nr:hypothetical protein [Chromatiales bacterium]